jgi:tRNA modification GTPase
LPLDDTIVAIATPPGRGGLGVVRLSGPEATSIAAPMLRLKQDLEPGRAIFGEFIEPDPPGRRIDEVVVTYFQRPRSYTADDVVEISGHGSPVVLRHIVEIALSGGARLAEPGEFTMRAFLNGRIDLAQAEAVRDLIDSQTLYQAQIAAQQLGGALSRSLQPAKKRLVELIALLEAGIDFADDDVPVLPVSTIHAHLAEIRPPLESLSSSFAYGKIVHEGLTLALVGRPNVGKSSLFNRLVERERAIVTATPGTTRDLVTEVVALAGIPLRLVDTAGIRDSKDEAETLGIQKSREALADADMVLVILDASQPMTDEDAALIAQAAQRKAIVVENKADLASAEPRVQKVSSPVVRTSALTGDGVPALREEILRQIHGTRAPQTETAFLTNLRHQRLVEQSLQSLGAAADALDGRVPHEMVLLDLYGALRALDEITGATTTDDILNLIFGTFCIGK